MVNGCIQSRCTHMLGSTAISPFSQKDTVGSSEQRLSIAGMWGRRSISQPSRQKWCLFFGLWEPLSQIAMPYPEKARRRHRIFTAAQIYTERKTAKKCRVSEIGIDWPYCCSMLQLNPQEIKPMFAESWGAAGSRAPSGDRVPRDQLHPWGQVGPGMGY